MIKLTEHRRRLVNLERRLLLRSSLSLGALAMLSGCNLQDNDQVDRVLWSMSRWNDRVQAWLFDPNRLAPYAARQITTPFPFMPSIPSSTHRKSTVRHTGSRSPVWSPTRSRGRWTGSADCRRRARSRATSASKAGARSATGAAYLSRRSSNASGPTPTARYVGFKCADRYCSSLDMATALHPQTQLTLDFGAQPLPTRYGYPLKLRVATKLGFKNPKHIAAVFVSNTNPGGYWEDQG
jgi:DMSO/TMAO reductase YedYZ molybdopterin-dependent catalytic subunit